MSNEKIDFEDEKEVSCCTSCKALFPMALLALVIVLFFGYQTSQILKEKTALEKAYQGQVQAVQNAEQMSKQLSGIIVGMKKLTDGGNEHTKGILERLVAETQNSARTGNRGALYLLDRLIAGGIVRVEKPEGATTQAPVPAAGEAAERGPVKP